MENPCVWHQLWERETRTGTSGIFLLLGLLLVMPGAAAAYDPSCVGDADCWARSLGKAAGVQYDGPSCNAFCSENHGPHSVGKLIGNACQCQCAPGFREDASLMCVRSAQSCDQDCRSYHSRSVYGAYAVGKVVNGVCQCSCREGYGPDEHLECVEIFSESDFDSVRGDEGMTDAAWETFQTKCGDLQEFSRGAGETFTVTQQEYIGYLRRVEEANPGASWKQILAALHVNRYPDDAFSRTLPIIGSPLFEWGPETDGWQDVDLLCRVSVLEKSAWYTPKFVLTDDGRMIETGHAYGGLRVGLNRESGIIGQATQKVYGRDAEADLWVMLITHYGDAWQVLIHNVVLREPGSRAPPDQVFGNNMGIWLVGYYRKNPGAPLSAAFQAYFDTRKGS